MTRLLVEPIYGWGWTDGAGAPRETPGPFTLGVMHEEPGAWQGVAQSAGHEFNGLSVSLTQRHTVRDGQVNVTVGPTTAVVAQGWAAVASLERR